MALLVYMPLHVFLAQSLSLITGGLEIWKLAKDLLLLAIAVFTICLVWWQKRRGTHDFNLLLALSAAYAGVHMAVWALHPDIYRDSALLGVLYNFRLFGFFFLGMGAPLLYGPKQISNTLVLKIVLGISTLVAIVGVAQYFLPHDILTHFGYGLNRGTLPAFFIDNRPDFPRIMSTLRDPNSLGAYLLIPITLLVALLVRTAYAKRRAVLAGLLVLHGVALFLTFSRGAWIAALLSVALVLGWQYAAVLKTLARRWWPVLVVAGVLALTGIFLARNTYAFKSVITHRTGAPQGVAYDSNGFHWVFAKRGLDGIVRSPFGHGPGTAGLASIQNPHGSFLTENYYIQIGYEVGVVGLALFLLLNALIYLRLRRHTDSVLAVALLATFWGYVVMNLLFHMWSNEAVAAQWWILAGLVSALPAGVASKT
jgi:Ca2+/Na+ antiporter